MAEFHRTHRRLYGHSFVDVPVELVNIRVTGLGSPEEPRMTWAFGVSERSGRSPDEARVRPVRFGDGREPVMTTIVQRAGLVAEDEVPGPAVILQSDSTIVLPPGARAKVRPSGAIVIAVNETEGSRTAGNHAMAARA